MQIASFIIGTIIVSMVFGFVWGIASFLLAFLSLIFKNKGYVFMIFVRIMGYYIWTSCLSLYTLWFLFKNEPNTLMAWTYIILGEVIIYFSYFGDLYDQLKKISTESSMNYNLLLNYEHREQQELLLKVSFWSILASMALFFVGLFIPKIVANPVTVFFVTAIERITNLPIIGFIIMILAGLAFLNYAFMALIGFGALIAKIMSFFGKKQEVSTAEINKIDINQANREELERLRKLKEEEGETNENE